MNHVHKIVPALVRISLRQPLLAALLVSLIAASDSGALASVTGAGDTSPTPANLPPAGGSVVAPLRIGVTSVGTLNISAGSALSVTGGSAIVGDTLTGVGIVQLTGLGSTLSTTNDLTIGNLGAGSVTVSQFAGITLSDDLFVGTGAASSGSLSVDGLGTLVDVNDTMTVGSAGRATVQITSGGRLDADDSILGQLAGSDGRFTVSDNGSRLNQTNSMTIGDAGRGELQVLSQGTAITTNVVVGNAATGIGVATVEGPASNWKIGGFLNLGVGGTATLNVLAGGQASTTLTLRTAIVAGGESHVVVKGASSLLTVGTTATIGEFGFGTLEVSGGGHMTSTNVLIADNVGSRGDALVDGAGSTWKIVGTLDVSEPGEAQLTVSNGGLVTATGVVRVGAAGRLVMAGGRVEAGGVGLTNSGVIQGGGRIVGSVANATAASMRLASGDSLILAGALTNAGLVDVNGGELETLAPVANNADIAARNGATLRFGSTGLDNNPGSQLAITGGTVDVFGAVDNNAGAQIAVVGGATGVFHDAVASGGTIFVSAGSEIATLENLSFVPSSQLGIQLASVGALGDSTDAFGLVDVSGAATLAGKLAVTLAPGFIPIVGNSYEVLRASSGVSGTFATETLPSLGVGLKFDVQYTPNSVLLAILGVSLQADFDANGVVNAADLAKWKRGFGTESGATRAQGDANGDGAVDGADLLVWQRELGNSSATVAAGQVPEPATAALAMLAACGAMACSKRRAPSAKVASVAARR